VSSRKKNGSAIVLVDLLEHTGGGMEAKQESHKVSSDSVCQ